jgi:hypothetical protein
MRNAETAEEQEVCAEVKEEFFTTKTITKRRRPQKKTLQSIGSGKFHTLRFMLKRTNKCQKSMVIGKIALVPAQGAKWAMCKKKFNKLRGDHIHL